MTFTTVVLAVILALIIGVALGWFLARSRGGSAEGLQRENAQLRADLAGATEARTLLSERVRDLEERSREDADVLQALGPVKTQLATMEKSVRSMEQQRAEQYGSVSEALQHSARTQEQLRAMTATLSTALRSSSARGTWGEAQLKRVVEAAGMTEHVSFSEQVSAQAANSSDRDAAVRPDMVIALPGGKTIVCDAKAPLVSYLNAQDAVKDTERADHLKRHAKAVRAHVDALASKRYWSGFDASPELVLCFIPVESALSAALTADATLLDYAASKNVALVSPVSLLSALKAISFSWRQDALTDNARELFALSKQLYERLGTAGMHLSSMGRMLGRTVQSYNSLVGSLESRVFVTARKIAALDSAGIVDDLTPSVLEETAKPITAAEFLEHVEEPDPASHQREETGAGATTEAAQQETDPAQSAYEEYMAALHENRLTDGSAEEPDHMLDPMKAAYTPTYEDIPLWEQYPDGFNEGADESFDDYDDGPAIITERPIPGQDTTKGRPSYDEQPFDYDSWNS